MTTKRKQKTWHQLKHKQCPNCGVELHKGMFGQEWVACMNCGFTIKEKVRDLIVKRDHTV